MLDLKYSRPQWDLSQLSALVAGIDSNSLSIFPLHVHGGFIFGKGPLLFLKQRQEDNLVRDNRCTLSHPPFLCSIGIRTQLSVLSWQSLYLQPFQPTERAVDS